MKNISLYTSNFRTNGVIKNRIRLAKEILDLGHRVQFVVSEDIGELRDEVHTLCDVYNLNATRPRAMTYALTRYLMSEQPDGMIAASWPNTLSAIVAKSIINSSCRLLVSEHIDFRTDTELTKKDRFILKYFGKYLYRKASAVVGVSTGVKDGIVSVTGAKSDDIFVVNNSVAPTKKLATGMEEEIKEWWNSKYRLLSVGRLAAAKRFDLLVEAIARLPDKLDFKLVIVGEGAERENIERKILDLGLEKKILLAGQQYDMHPFYSNANLYVMSSSSEGFPNVLLEALSYGIEIVSTDCRSGPADILEDGKYGTLCEVNNSLSISEGILSAIKIPSRSDILIQHSRKFHPSVQAARYLELLFGT